jgi:hypothetical protein
MLKEDDSQQDGHTSLVLTLHVDKNSLYNNIYFNQTVNDNKLV